METLVISRLSKPNLVLLCQAYRQVLKTNKIVLPFYMKDIFNQAANLDFRNARENIDNASL